MAHAQDAASPRDDAEHVGAERADADPVILTPAGIAPSWEMLRLASAAELGAVKPEATEAPEPERVGIPAPDEYSGGRVSRGGGHHNRREKDIRTFGVQILPAYAILTGQVVGRAFNNGPTITIRLLANMSSANQFMLDISYGIHSMKDPRPMFFRTAVTPTSSYSGELDVICPAIYYAEVVPLGEDFHHAATILPKFYIGLGPMISKASGRVTNAGDKGTVTGQGTQPFLQFTPGLAVDARVYDYVFVGADFKYRITVPTQRPDLAKEFTIPKMYVFEAGLSAGYFFY